MSGSPIIILTCCYMIPPHEVVPMECSMDRALSSRELEPVLPVRAVSLDELYCRISGDLAINASPVLVGLVVEEDCTRI